MEGNARKAGMIVLGMGAVILMIIGTIGCGPRTPFESGAPAWSPWKGRHGFHGKDFPEHALKHMDDRVQALDLTIAQKEQYAAVRERAKAELIAGKEKRRRLMVHIRKEMQKDLPDLHAVASLVSEHVGMIPQAIDRGMDLFLEFYECLDEAQKARVTKHLRDRLIVA